MARDSYELIDSGGEEKLERFGEYLLARPDPQALWPKMKPSLWKDADLVYERKGAQGSWKSLKQTPQEWPIEFAKLHLLIRPTSFKHVGLFPEQSANWEWMQKVIMSAGRDVSVLNLFAYTGGATLQALRVGAKVTHLDASKTAVEWAKKNAELSGLASEPVRWIVDDAISFVKKEAKRGKTYDAIIMDPPAFGHGPQKELWKIEKDFLPIMELSKKLFSDTPLFVLLNGYAAGYSSLVFKQNLDPLQESLGGIVEHGELFIPESGSARRLPAGIFAHWSR